MFLVAYEYPEGEPLPVANEPDGVNNFTYISYDQAGLDWKRELWGANKHKEETT